MPRPNHSLIFKNAIFRIEDYFALIPIIIGGYLLITTEDLIWLGIAIVLVLPFVFKMFKRLNNRTPQVIIDINGINLVNENKTFKWEIIEDTYIDSQIHGTGKNSEIIAYLFIVVNRSKIKKNINDLNYSFTDFHTIVPSLSGKNIGKNDKQLNPKNLKEKILSVIPNREDWRYDKAYYTLSFFLGLAAIISEIFLFRRTIISPYIPLLIIICGGIMTFFITRKHYEKTFTYKGVFFPLLQNICSWGFLLSFFFMAGNFYLSNDISEDSKFRIVEKTSMSGSKGHRNERKPLVKFKYKGKIKELVFSFAETDKILTADSVHLTVKKGRFGFEIMEKYDAF
jgi:hypothetical protein